MAVSRSPVHTVLGVSGDYHDAAAALVVDGTVVAAAEEERFTRRKHDPSLPRHAIRWCLEDAGVGPGELDLVVFHEKPLSAYDRILTTHALAGPRGFRSLARAVGRWSTSKLWVGYRLERLLLSLGHRVPRIEYAGHHESHAAAAFYPSPFDRAAILTFDGVGEWATSSIGWGAGHRVELRAETRFPDSLGLLYSAFTTFCGFAANDGEYKLMGLAPYGEPRYVDVLRDQVVDILPDGSVRLDQRWFDYKAGSRMTRPRLGTLLDGPALPLGTPPGLREADIARSIQVVVEDAVLAMARRAEELTGERNACLAGGVALNCVANSRLLEEGPFDDVWVQPAAGDSGSAIGAALWAWHQRLDQPRPTAPQPDGMRGSFLGPAYDHEEIVAWLDAEGIHHEEHTTHAALCESVARCLDEGDVVGWFQGAMEFGPRALGHRSILADARDPAMVQRINQAVKQREGFRPFAPAVLAEHAGEWFDVAGDRPYMTFTAPVRARRDGSAAPRVRADGAGGFASLLAEPRSDVPAVTHVDGSARLQTVDRERNPTFHALLTAFHRRTGCPVLVNTSFNRSDEPIVRSPADAYRCFAGTDLDVLVLERSVIRRDALAPPTPGAAP